VDAKDALITESFAQPHETTNFVMPAEETVSQLSNLHVCHSERSEESNKNKTLEQRDSSAKASE